MCVCRFTSRTGQSQTALGCGGTCKARLRYLKRCCTQRRYRKRSQPVCQCVRCLHVTKPVARFPTQWCHFWTPGPKACSPSTLSLASSPLSPVLIGQKAFKPFSFNLHYVDSKYYKKVLLYYKKAHSQNIIWLPLQQNYCTAMFHFKNFFYVELDIIKQYYVG